MLSNFHSLQSLYLRMVIKLNLLDLCLIGIIVIGAYMGYKKGLVAAVSATVGILISILAAFWLYKPVALFLDGRFMLSEKISPWITQKLAIPVDSLNTKVNASFSDALALLVNKLETPDFIKDLILNHISQTAAVPVASGLSTASQGLALALSSLFLSALSFLLVYIIFKLLFQLFLPKMAASIFPKPVRALDRLAGMALGAGAGVLSIIVVTIVLTPLASLSALQGKEALLVNQMGGSQIVNTVMEYIGSLW